MRTLRNALIVPAVIMAAAACGSGSTANNVNANAATPSAGVSGNAISLKETEYTLAPSALTLKPGTYTVTVMNVGQFPHDVHVATSADGTEVGGSTVVAAGQSAQFMITVQTGQYTMWCAVDAHKSLGMSGTINVQ